MHQNILGKNVRITEKVKEHIADKILKIKHYSDKIVDASVVCHHEHNDYTAEITLIFYKKILHIKHIDTDLYVAIDAMFDKLEREVKKIKEMMQDHKGPGKDIEPKIDAGSEYDIEVEPIFHKPITDIVEAVMQCDLIGKNHFVYYPIKKSDDAFNVRIGTTPIFLFKCDDGSYIEIARDEDDYYDDEWNEIKIKLAGDHIVEISHNEYELYEHNASKAIETMINEKDKKYIVYINSITNYPECIYRESATKFKIIRVLNF